MALVRIVECSKCGAPWVLRVALSLTSGDRKWLYQRDCKCGRTAEARLSAESAELGSCRVSRPSYEDQARRAKAHQIAQCCTEHGWSASDLVGLNATERADLCTIAGVNVASDKTWALVIGLLGAHEPMPAAMRAALPADPFENLS